MNISLTHSLSIHRIEIVLLDRGFHIPIIFIFDHVILFEGKFDVGVTCPHGVLVLEVGGFIVELREDVGAIHKLDMMEEVANTKERVRNMTLNVLQDA
mmetsp:Transcript_20025/g.30504  ORF Transcript_20025/g.30504 Transcript_20025/m.30504 type:complete len:98 (-) Transcript_20025:203-496(-)|eukprot:scaffold3924_cov132-Skeletonema_marinoi.AAC.2